MAQTSPDDVIRRPERLGDDGAADLGLAGANRGRGPTLRLEGYTWVGLAPPESQRSIAGVRHGGSPKQGEHRGGDPPPAPSQATGAGCAAAAAVAGPTRARRRGAPGWTGGAGRWR